MIQDESWKRPSGYTATKFTDALKSKFRSSGDLKAEGLRSRMNSIVKRSSFVQFPPGTQQHPNNRPTTNNSDSSSSMHSSVQRSAAAAGGLLPQLASHHHHNHAVVIPRSESPLALSRRSYGRTETPPSIPSLKPPLSSKGPAFGAEPIRPHSSMDSGCAFSNNLPTSAPPLLPDGAAPQMLIVRPWTTVTISDEQIWWGGGGGAEDAASRGGEGSKVQNSNSNSEPSTPLVSVPSSEKPNSKRKSAAAIPAIISALSSSETKQGCGGGAVSTTPSLSVTPSLLCFGENSRPISRAEGEGRRLISAVEQQLSNMGEHTQSAEAQRGRAQHRNGALVEWGKTRAALVLQPLPLRMPTRISSILAKTMEFNRCHSPGYGDDGGGRKRPMIIPSTAEGRSDDSEESLIPLQRSTTPMTQRVMYERILQQN